MSEAVETAPAEAAHAEATAPTLTTESDRIAAAAKLLGDDAPPAASLMDEASGNHPEASGKTTEEPGKPAEEQAAPQEEAKPEKPEDKPDWKKFQALRNEEHKVKREREKLAKERAALEAAQKAGTADQFFNDPLAFVQAYAERSGIDVREAYKRITERIVTGRAPVEEQVSPVAAEVKALRDEIAAMKAEKAEQQREIAIATVKNDLIGEIAARADEFPLLAAYKPADVANHAFEIMRKAYESGTTLDYAGALRHIHADLEQDHSRRVEALAKRGARQPGQQQPTGAVNGQVARKPVSTLTDRDAKAPSASPDYSKLDDAERIRVAASLLG